MADGNEDDKNLPAKPDAGSSLVKAAEPRRISADDLAQHFAQQVMEAKTPEEKAKYDLLYKDMVRHRREPAMAIARIFVGIFLVGVSVYSLTLGLPLEIATIFAVGGLHLIAPDFIETYAKIGGQ